ncbi:fungal transcriptional regulatory protein [Pochonia chlamydosporia 170]|uniref:Fungal transcriptional regulatory protein n=1 Tax=Pochonia chlamydosporia 170 TaxID=1380566 RepID=A0A179FG44_METCM|nr:fungal transcriptional regulatory protein [Pochonia chlamydosporia 170]OAQ64318.2 fungal transcriptional regulatory protein [Pochonia chlamydosporia 170]
MEESSAEPVRHRIACTECQRRKQKCNREWPCIHCQRRKVADKCRFNLPAPPQSRSGKGTLTTESKKRHADWGTAEPPANSDAEGSIQSFGYAAAEMLARLGIADKDDDPGDGQYWTSAATCSMLDRVLKQLPKRSRVVQHADMTTRLSIETEMGDNIDAISQKYHSLAQELGNVIPMGYHHIYRCQWLLHSTYWFVSQGKYMESWHVLSAAAREASELGLAKDMESGRLPQFDREMRRRVWQISAGLSRSTIISWPDVEIVFPSLTMDGCDPSPILHMRLQSEVITNLAVEYPNPNAVVTPEQIQHYQGLISGWARSFPPVYALDKPDTTQDSDNPWIGFNRYYLHTIYYFFMLTPIRPYMAKEYPQESDEAEVTIRTKGIEYCLGNLRSDAKWVEHISKHGGGFHFMLFSLLDTVALLSTTLMKDTHKTITNLVEIYDEVNNALTLLAGIRETSSTATMAYYALGKVVEGFPKPASSIQQQKKQKRDDSQAPSAHPPKGHLPHNTINPAMLHDSSESSPESHGPMMTPGTTPSPRHDVGADDFASRNSPQYAPDPTDNSSIDERILQTAEQSGDEGHHIDRGSQHVGLDETLLSFDGLTAIWDGDNIDWDLIEHTRRR